MRTLSALRALLFFSVVCGACNAASDPATGGFVGPAPREPATNAPSVGDAGADAPKGAMIAGRVQTDDGQPIIGRPIAVVDARGERREVLSDEGGTFYVADVARPYDLVVAGAPSGDIRAPTVFLGLTRTDPFVELFERDGPTLQPAPQKLRFAVNPPPCKGNSAPCTIAVASGSASGAGASAVPYRDETSVWFEIDHEWKSFVTAKETIDLHVLTFDGALTSFAHASREGIPAEAGDITELGILQPTSVPVSAPLVVSASARGPAAAWAPSIATWLDFPNGASLSLTYDAKREEMLSVPLLRGVTIRANAWMQHPPITDRPQFHTAVQAWSGTRTISADGGALPLDLPTPPVLVRPEMDGTLSARGLGLAWRNPPSAPMALTEVTIARVETGALRYRVWTIGDEVPFARLALLGVHALMPGDHVIGITSSPIDALDDLVSPDPAMRHARQDPRRKGAATYQRFRFQVTP